MMRLHKQAMILSAITALFVSACVPITPPASPAPTEAGTPEPVHWGYEGEVGPEEWGGLSPDYAVCDEGASQSPIAIAEAAEDDLENIVFSYQPTKLNIVNNGHTIQVNYDEGSYIEVGGTRYDLLQFHFHVPSEHQVDGQPHDGEIHLVHKSADGATAVIGLFLVNGTVTNTFLAPVFDNLPTEEGPAETIDVEINAGFFLPMGKATYSYSGSLTTPPCTEGVNWFVLTLPIEVSAEQFDSLAAVIDGNNRPVQPINGRTITEDTTH